MGILASVINNKITLLCSKMKRSAAQKVSLSTIVIQIQLSHEYRTDLKWIFDLDSSITIYRENNYFTYNSTRRSIT